MNIHNLPLKGGRIGIEREALRCTPEAYLAQTPHPKALGCAATHPHITIDYGEALLELVTAAHDDAQQVYQELLDLHRFTAQTLNHNQEMMWAASMPCILPEEHDIQLGYFGQNHSGTIRRLYREGLALRYGRFMQMIAGIHYNYSPPELLFKTLAERDGEIDHQDYRNKRFMNMLRSLQKISWLLCYSYGASPAVDISFKPALNQLNHIHANTLSWSQASTLRMSQLGYQNKVDFSVSLNDVKNYARDLMTAVLTPAPVYEYLGLRNAQGDYQQISTHILQIENEYYSAARPKQPTRKGETPSVALLNRGIAYVELRILDVNPYEPCGISLAQIRVLEALMLWALLEETPPFSSQQWNELNHNRLRTACCGLNPESALFDAGKTRRIGDWAKDLWSEIAQVAAGLSVEHARAVEALIDAEPLAQRVQRDLKQQSHWEWGLKLSQAHHQSLQKALPRERLEALQHLAAQSWHDFEALEALPPSESFDDFLRHYFDGLRTAYARLNQ